MKQKNLLKSYLLILLVLLVACESEEEPYVLDPLNIAGEITTQVTLESDVVYYLDGALIVENGGMLNIPAGTQIIVKGGTSSYVAVARGGQIYAKGTASAPVVFTSDVKSAGSWGGLVICGKAATNLMGNGANPVQAEVSDMLYGGNENDDNSGELSYVRVEYSGYNYDDDKQFNGFSFFGVGSGTVIDHIASYASQDDGIEFYGGNVSANFLVSINSLDDGIDFTDGWQGEGQYWYAYNSARSGVEGSNNDSNGAATPTTSAQLSDITIYKMGERPWYLKKGAGNQLVDNVVIGGLPDNVGDAYFYYEDNDINTIVNVNAQKIQFSNVRFVDRGIGNTVNASGALKISLNENSVGAGRWTDAETLAPSWAADWTLPSK